MKKLLTVHSSTLYLILLSVVLLFTSEAILSKEYTVFTSGTPPTRKGFHSESFVVFNGHHDRLPKDEPFEKMKHLMDIPVAWATFDNEIQSNGWSTLQIKTNEKFDNEQQAFAAGYLEGFATAELIGPYWHAFKDYNYNNSLKSQFDDYLVKQFQYMEENVYAKKHDDLLEKQFWNMVGLIVLQVRGMHAGYEYMSANHSKLEPMSFFDFWKFQFDGDTGDIQSSISPVDFSKMTGEQISSYAMFNSKCSAIIKYTPGRQNLLIAHSTWDTYANQLRVYKHMELNYKNHGILPVLQASNHISFSSSPAWIASADDFYITSGGLVVTETTNNIFDNSLYKLVTPQSVPYWIRNTIANRIASNAKEWTTLFSIENSGTYNNQWLIVDLKKFVPAANKTDPDMFHVLEQIPGKMVTSSASQYLDRDGYWASYNIPFYPEIYNISGYVQMAQQYGDIWTHDHCPRANIFRKYQSSATDIDSLKLLIRRNNWKDDPFSLGDACYQIAARCDLNSPSIGNHYRAFGQIDAKITDVILAKQLKSIAQSGPTYGGVGNNPPFSWSKSAFSNSVSHILQPDTFDFDFVPMQPRDPFPN